MRAARRRRRARVAAEAASSARLLGRRREGNPARRRDVVVAARQAELDGFALRQRHRRVVARERAAELGPLDVAEDLDVAARLGGEAPDVGHELLELPRPAVRRVEAEDVDARRDELGEHLDRLRGRPERRHDLALAVERVHVDRVEEAHVQILLRVLGRERHGHTGRGPACGEGRRGGGRAARPRGWAEEAEAEAEGCDSDKDSPARREGQRGEQVA